MDQFPQSKTKSSQGSAIGFVLAAALVVLLLLYALFAGGGVSTTVDPATLVAPDQTAPTLDDSAPVQPVAPASDG